MYDATEFVHTLVRLDDEPRSCKHQLDISLSTSSCLALVSLMMFFFCRHCRRAWEGTNAIVTGFVADSVP